MSLTFLSVSAAAERSLEFLDFAAWLAGEGRGDDALDALRAIAVLVKVGAREVVEAKRDDLARVADGNYGWHASAHEATAQMWVLVSLLINQIDYRVSPDLLEQLHIDTGQLRAGIVRERARLQVAPPPPSNQQPLTTKEWSVLQTLAKEYPLAVLLVDLAAKTGIERKTIGKLLQSLIDSGFAERKSPRGGAAITPAGRELLRGSPLTPP